MAEKANKQEKKGKTGGAGPGAANEAKKAAAAARRAAKAAGEAQKGAADDDEPQAPAEPPRLIATYRDSVIPALTEKFGYKNRMAVPKLQKIVISMGVGRFATEGGEGKGKIDKVERELTVIAGQKPVRTKAKKSVANFKVREGQETGLKVTLRGNRMYEFLDRLISLAFPRVKDFRGVNPDAFDQDGNYNFGFTEQTVFPEVDGASVTFQQGMNITVVTSAAKVDEGRELLKQFGFPFRAEAKLAK